MKLYPKKINSLDELLKEKQRLKKEMLHTGLVSFTLHDIVSETNHSKEEVAQEQSPYLEKTALSLHYLKLYRLL